MALAPGLHTSFPQDPTPGSLVNAWQGSGPLPPATYGPCGKIPFPFC